MKEFLKFISLIQEDSTMIKNLTKDDVVILDKNNKEIATYPGYVGDKRVTTSTKYKPAPAIDGIPVSKKDSVTVSNLPDPKDGVYYIVYNSVKNACPKRTDLLITGRVVKDKASGKIIGYTGLNQ